MLYELNFLLSNFLHGGLLVVLLLGFLWGSHLDGGGRLLVSSLLGFRGSSLRRWLLRILAVVLFVFLKSLTHTLGDEQHISSSLPDTTSLGNRA